MSPLTAFINGFCKPILAIGFLLSTRGVKRFAVLPLIVNFLVYILVFSLLIWLISGINFAVGDWSFWGPVGGWLSSAINFTLGPLKWIVAIPVMLIMAYFSFTIVGMIIASPFNDMLSARVERALTDSRDDVKLPLMTTGKLMVMGILDGLAILGRELVVIVLVLPFLLVPVVGFLPLFFVAAYFSGLGYFDYSMARNNLRNRHKWPVTRNHRWEMLGMGVMMELLFLIPFVNLLIMPLGVVGGTMLYCDIDWEKELAAAGLEEPAGFSPPRVSSR